MKEIQLSSGKTIKMRSPKVRDMRAVADIANDVEREVRLISNLTEIPLEEIDEMDYADYLKIQEVLKGFLS